MNTSGFVVRIVADEKDDTLIEKKYCVNSLSFELLHI